MYFELKDTTADLLAKSRRHEELCDLPLDLIASEHEAYDIQTAAQDALGFERKGYAIVGTSDLSRRALGLKGPIYSEIPSAALQKRAQIFRLPPGTIGIQCELVFTMLRPFPDEGEQITLDSVADAVMSCRPAIGVIGRRTRQAFAGANAAIADFGLHVATLCGDHAGNVDIGDLSEIEVTAFLFRQTMLSGNSSAIMGNPLNAVAWLAAALAANGRRLEPSDIVATGSCTAVLQVCAGQHLAVDFGPLGQVECVFN
ncbi:hydratase [Rhizobium hainanense]|uniref:2-oxo-3-hexenedioate decarboxylase n=1 Tax=Rhizobium hainanense TaxID=52131 RepID=A0A1C3UVW1_9HYPH|nr:hydratase [Rhizobium hainanense]SCB19437.1 2-oxo-3-hexenedioate decarboxylase [Rhizobium hainanense]